MNICAEESDGIINTPIRPITAKRVELDTKPPYQSWVIWETFNEHAIGSDRLLPPISTTVFAKRGPKTRNHLRNRPQLN